VVARIFRRGASSLLRAPVAGEELLGPPAEQERVGALVGLVDESHGLVVAHPHGPSAALESVPAVLIRRAAFPCITPSTVTCVMVVSFMGSSFLSWWSFSL
jgi:hypothetical protein